MTKIIIDSSAWIEYFAGTEKGRKVQEWVHKPETAIYITGLIVSEICTKFLKDNIALKPEVLLKNLTILEPYDYELGRETAKAYVIERKAKPKFGLADAHVLATARRKHAKLITCDNDFSHCSEAVIIA